MTSACESDEFQCATTADYKCIDSDWVCDGDNDCDDWSDEREPLGKLLFKCNMLQLLVSTVKKYFFTLLVTNTHR